MDSYTDLHQARLAARDQQLSVAAVASRVRAILEPRELPLPALLPTTIAQQNLRRQVKC